MSLQPFLSTELTLRLGWTLAHSLWEGAAVAVILWMALAVLRPRSPQTRYLLSTGAMAVMLAGVVVTFYRTSVSPPARPLFDRTISEAGNAADFRPGVSNPKPVARPEAIGMPATSPLPAAAGPRVEASTLAFSPAPPTFAMRFEPLMPWVAGTWAAGVLLMSLWNIGGWIAAQRLKVLGTRPVGADLAAIAEDLRRRLKLSRPVRVLESLLAQTPAVIGCIRPVVLLPVSILAGLSHKQLEAILAHELAHVRRHDYLVNLFVVAVETFLFYHPAVWWCSRQIRLEREQCCDDIAVSVCGDRCAYVESLAALEEVRGRSPWALAARGSGASQLMIRVRRLLGFGNDPPQRSAQALTAGAVFLLALAGVVFHRFPIAAVRAASPAAAPATRPVANAGPQDVVGPVRYRPLVERSFPAAALQQPVYFNFETGQQITAPKGLDAEALLKWAREAQVDLEIRHGDEAAQVSGFDFFAAFGRKDGFEPGNALSQLEWFGWPSTARLRRTDSGRLDLSKVDRRNASTITFETRTGCMGLLTFDPAEGGGLKMRYLLLEAGLAGGKEFTPRLGPVAMRLAALNQLKRRSAVSDLNLLLHLNGRDIPGIEKLGDGNKPEGAIRTGIGEVAQIKSAGHEYTAVAARIYPPAFNSILNRWGLGAAFFFDELGGLVGQVGGELGSDGANGDDVVFPAIKGEDPWCAIVERFEKNGDFEYRQDVYLIEPGFPRALRVWTPAGGGGPVSKAAEDGDGPHYGLVFAGKPKAGGNSEWTAIEWDPTKRVFHGPANFSVDGKPVMQVDAAASERFEATAASSKGGAEKAPVAPPATAPVAPAKERGPQPHIDALGAVGVYDRVPAEDRGPLGPQAVPIVFSVPGSEIKPLIQRLDAHQTIPVDVYDRMITQPLGHGSLVGVDAQIDGPTGTLKCKATVLPVLDSLLFPNQFVNVRVHLEPLKPATAPSGGSSDARRAVQLLKLDQARVEANVQQKRMEAGLTDVAAVVAAKNRVLILEAELAGDPVRIAQAKLDAARREMDLSAKRADVGIAEAGEYPAAKDKVALAAAELRAAEQEAAHTGPATQPTTLPHLQFRRVAGPEDTSEADELIEPGYKQPLRVLRAVELDERDVARAAEPQGQSGVVVIHFTAAGAKKFEVLTAAHLHHRLAIVLDGKLLSAPMIQTTISQSALITSGPGFTEEQTKAMVESINALTAP